MTDCCIPQQNLSSIATVTLSPGAKVCLNDRVAPPVIKDEIVKGNGTDPTFLKGSLQVYFLLAITGTRYSDFVYTKLYDSVGTFVTSTNKPRGVRVRIELLPTYPAMFSEGLGMPQRFGRDLY